MHWNFIFETVQNLENRRSVLRLTLYMDDRYDIVVSVLSIENEGWAWGCHLAKWTWQRECQNRRKGDQSSWVNSFFNESRPPPGWSELTVKYLIRTLKPSNSIIRGRVLKPTTTVFNLKESQHLPASSSNESIERRSWGEARTIQWM